LYKAIAAAGGGAMLVMSPVSEIDRSRWWLPTILSGSTMSWRASHLLLSSLVPTATGLSQFGTEGLLSARGSIAARIWLDDSA
jgi:hypothetical protein